MTNVNSMTDAEMAEYYDRTHDTSEFDDGEVVVPPKSKQTRNVTISVRFAPGELEDLEGQASAAGMPVTTYIRSVALAAKEPPIDRDGVLDLLAALRRKIDPHRAGPDAKAG